MSATRQQATCGPAPHPAQTGRVDTRLAVIVPTKDRPDDLRHLLLSLQEQTVRPGQVVVVDASTESVEPVLRSCPGLCGRYLRYDRPPSASGQRNAGLARVSSEATLVGFVDDDTTFEPDAVEAMLAFWETAADEVAGAAFNVLNYELPPCQLVKRSWLAERLGLYSPRMGEVLPSGWQTVIGTVTQTQYAQWLGSGAVVWRSSVLQHHRFDEFFSGYSYLEDLDFSYGVARQHRLAVVAVAGYYHHPSPDGRPSWRQFGRTEVRNRRYFVRKHRLSMARCHLGLAIRMAMTLGTAVVRLDRGALARFAGNLEGLCQRPA